MNNLTFTRIILQIALVGATLTGAIFGFWIKGDDLELIRMIGAIVLILFFVIFYPSFFKQAQTN